MKLTFRYKHLFLTLCLYSSVKISFGYQTITNSVEYFRNYGGSKLEEISCVKFIINSFKIECSSGTFWSKTLKLSVGMNCNLRFPYFKLSEKLISVLNYWICFPKIQFKKNTTIMSKLTIRIGNLQILWNLYITN